MIFWLFTALEQAKKSIMLYSTFSFFCFLADVVECGQHRDQVSMRKAPQRPSNVLQRFDTSQARQRVIAAFCREDHLKLAKYSEKFSQWQDLVKAMGPISSNWFDFCALERIDKI